MDAPHSSLSKSTSTTSKSLSLAIINTTKRTSTIQPYFIGLKALFRAEVNVNQFTNTRLDREFLNILLYKLITIIHPQSKRDFKLYYPIKNDQQYQKFINIMANIINEKKLTKTKVNIVKLNATGGSPIRQILSNLTEKALLVEIEKLCSKLNIKYDNFINKDLNVLLQENELNHRNIDLLMKDCFDHYDKVSLKQLEMSKMDDLWNHMNNKVGIKGPILANSENHMKLNEALDAKFSTIVNEFDSMVQIVQTSIADLSPVCCQKNRRKSQAFTRLKSCLLKSNKAVREPTEDGLLETEIDDYLMDLKIELASIERQVLDRKEVKERLMWFEQAIPVINLCNQ